MGDLASVDNALPDPRGRERDSEGLMCCQVAIDNECSDCTPRLELTWKFRQMGIRQKRLGEVMEHLKSKLTQTSCMISR